MESSENQSKLRCSAKKNKHLQDTVHIEEGPDPSPLPKAGLLRLEVCIKSPSSEDVLAGKKMPQSEKRL